MVNAADDNAKRDGEQSIPRDDVCVFVHFVVCEVLIQAPVNVPLLIAAFPNVDIHVRKSANYVADRLKCHVVCDPLHLHIE